MLRRVILSSKQLLANFGQRSSQRAHFTMSTAGPSLLYDRTEGSQEANSGLFQLDKNSFQLRTSVKRFVARPDKSLSTTRRTLCQEFFMAKIVFFNAFVWLRTWVAVSQNSSRQQRCRNSSRPVLMR